MRLASQDVKSAADWPATCNISFHTNAQQTVNGAWSRDDRNEPNTEERAVKKFLTIAAVGLGLATFGMTSSAKAMEPVQTAYGYGYGNNWNSGYRHNNYNHGWSNNNWNRGYWNRPAAPVYRAPAYGYGYGYGYGVPTYGSGVVIGTPGFGIGCGW
jgi:hypothetical protein